MSMDEHGKCGECAKCGQPASMQCCRCVAAFYCSKKCQTDAWPTHRRTCAPTRYNKYAECVFKKLQGNVLIMSAHFPNQGIRVEFDETIEQFMASREHFANICAHAHANAHTNTSTCTITFKDYSAAFRFTQCDNAAVKNKYTIPGSEWLVALSM